MSAPPFFQFYPSDWLAGTRGLTAAETGIYITLIAMMYEREAPLSMDNARLARLCGSTASAFEKAVSSLIEQGKIINTDGGFWNARVAIEIEKRSEKRKVAATSANKRWGKNEQNQQAPDANASNSQCQADANQIPDTRVKEEANASSKKRGSSLSPEWRLPKAWGEWAVAEGLSEIDARRESDRFRDYWIGIPGSRGVKADWLATWRNWVRKVIADRAAKARPARDPDTFGAFGNIREVS